MTYRELQRFARVLLLSRTLSIVTPPETRLDHSQKPTRILNRGLSAGAVKTLWVQPHSRSRCSGDAWEKDTTI